MLSAEALRLAAIEVLTPLAAINAGSGFPTLAGKKVYDSRAAAVGDLDETAAYTPVLSLYTVSARSVARSDAAAVDDAECETVLEIVAELAVAAKDEATGEIFSDAMAAADPETRLVLATLTAQVVFLLRESQAGYLFRQFCLGIRRIEEETFAVPSLGLRWQRTSIRLTCGIPEDGYVRTGGLPEPLRSLVFQLPAGSYARTKLELLAASFLSDVPPALAGVTIHRDDNPVASTGAT